MVAIEVFKGIHFLLAPLIFHHCGSDETKIGLAPLICHWISPKMVYINSDGSIGARPWYKQLTVFFWGMINFVSAFFRTLINPALNGKGNDYVSDYRGPGGGPPRPPQRRVGRFATLSSCQAPMPGGG